MENLPIVVTMPVRIRWSSSILCNISEGEVLVVTTDGWEGKFHVPVVGGPGKLESGQFSSVFDNHDKSLICRRLALAASGCSICMVSCCDRKEVCSSRTGELRKVEVDEDGEVDIIWSRVDFKKYSMRSCIRPS